MGKLMPTAFLSAWWPECESTSQDEGIGQDPRLSGNRLLIGTRNIITAFAYYC
jgi:hypothetical protein